MVERLSEMFQPGASERSKISALSGWSIRQMGGEEPAVSVTKTLPLENRPALENPQMVDVGEYALGWMNDPLCPGAALVFVPDRDQPDLVGSIQVHFETRSGEIPRGAAKVAREIERLLQEPVGQSAA